MVVTLLTCRGTEGNHEKAGMGLEGNDTEKDVERAQEDQDMARTPDLKRYNDA